MGFHLPTKLVTSAQKSAPNGGNSFEGESFHSLAFPQVNELPFSKVSESNIGEPWDVYPSDSPPVFVGHYWLPPQSPAPFQNVICLDYSVAKKWICGRLSLEPFVVKSALLIS